MCRYPALLVQWSSASLCAPSLHDGNKNVIRLGRRASLRVSHSLQKSPKENADLLFVSVCRFLCRCQELQLLLLHLTKASVADSWQWAPSPFLRCNMRSLPKCQLAAMASAPLPLQANIRPHDNTLISATGWRRARLEPNNGRGLIELQQLRESLYCHALKCATCPCWDASCSPNQHSGILCILLAQ